MHSRTSKFLQTCLPLCPYFLSQSDLSLSECAELLIYRHVWPERDRARRTEAVNAELKGRLEDVEREAAQLAASLQTRSADGQTLTSNLRQKEAEVQQIRDNLKGGRGGAMESEHSIAEVANGTAVPAV